MSIIHLTGFMSDSIFSPVDRIVLDADASVIGKLDSQLVNYFVQIGELYDKRAQRLSLVGGAATGQMTMRFDMTKVEQPTVVTGLTAIQYDALFGIAEIGYLSQNKSVDELDYLIRNETALVDFYVPESILVSPSVVTTQVYSPTTETVKIPNWIEFSIYTDLDHTTTLKVKLWLNSADFKVAYPYTTITRVILPRDPKILIAPSVTMNDILAVIDGSTYSFNQIDGDLYTNDQSGLFTFTTRYVLSAEKEYRLPIGIMYKGATRPTTMACRAAVKAHILSLGIINEDNLKLLMPELFVELQFFLVPLWDYFTKQGNRKVYPSISPNCDYVSGKLKKLYPSLEISYFSSKAVFLLNAYNDMWMVAIPDPLNGDDTTLLDLHPTYNMHPSAMDEFNYMDTEAKQLSQRLVYVLPVLLQLATSNDFNTFVQDGRHYLSFVIGRAEYQVMTPESYLEGVA